MSGSEIPLFMDNPEWADFIPDMKPGGPKCRLPTHEDCTPLDVDAAARHLEAGGTLGGMAGYESRPGQLDMLREAGCELVQGYYFSPPVPAEKIEALLVDENSRREEAAQ